MGTTRDSWPSMGAKVTLEELEGFFVHLRLKLLTLPVWGPWQVK